MNKVPLLSACAALLLLGCQQSPVLNQTEGLVAKDAIQPFQNNPSYWQYQGKPSLLLGGSSDDNLFQRDNLKQELTQLQALGGNFVRSTMSSRDEQDEKPYLTNQAGLYDLNQHNPAYWQNFIDFLNLTESLDIIVQLEIWATYDFYWQQHGWVQNVFNPKLNVNYSAETAHIPDVIDYPAQNTVNPFFKSVPQLNNNQTLLSYQQNYVDKLLSIALEYDHVLYSIDNETNAPHEWAEYWSDYIRSKAKASKNKSIFVTEMWDSFDPSEGEVTGALQQSPKLGGWFAEYTNPELHKKAQFKFSLNNAESFQFLDVSNHNSQTGETHYQTALWVYEAVKQSDKVRPINNVKIYGGDLDFIWSGDRKEGTERFWRNVFAGHAAVRFHRQPTGIGIIKQAQQQIKSMRMLTDSVNFFSLKPANHLLSKRQENEAYCLANDEQALLYFPGNASVYLELTGSYKVQFLDIESSQWRPAKQMQFPAMISYAENKAAAVKITKAD